MKSWKMTNPARMSLFSSSANRSFRYSSLSAAAIVTAALCISLWNPLTGTASASHAGTGSSMPDIVQHTGMGYTAGHSTTSEIQSTALASVPGSLIDFADDTVDQLSAHAPFTAWNEAELEFTPLGPGTHGWLITISNEGLPQGYMIISAADDGGYILSEYGIGSTLPYSQAPLNERLAADGLMKTGGTLPKGSTIQKLYGVSPVWQVKLPGQKAVYFSALNSELLPDEAQQASNKAATSRSTTRGIVTSMSSSVWLAERPSIRSDNLTDPYDNLLWLTAGGLSPRSSAELRSLLQEHSSLIFRSKGSNADVGAPLSLTGWHRWSSENQSNPAAIYVSVPLRNTDTLRFLPASRLIGQGQFYAVPV